MLRISRLRVEINTIKGTYGIDESFKDGLNFIASFENTCGKSSILAAIYYCLGFEQILGGAGRIGSKVLTSAFKTAIEDNGESLTVTESGAYLEINNGNETRTIYRNIKSESKDNHLVTVYYGNYNSISNNKILSEDYYVNIQNSATSEKGFHTFLEEFLHMELPLVRTSDGNERKLYLQMIFASMFIEQKHGWSDILSGMPVFGIRESKKRIVEYILGLDTLKNEKERDRLNIVKTQIEYKWDQLISDFKKAVHSELCEVSNLPIHPQVLSDIDYSRIVVSVLGSASIKEEIQSLNGEYNGLRQLKPLVCDNFDALNIELSETETQILAFENRLDEINRSLASCNEAIKRLNSDLILVKSDIRNNNDAARLQKFGSETVGGDISSNICPVCKQHIQDNLLNAETVSGFMSIEDNIRHLREQKKMLEFTLGSRKELHKKLNREKDDLEVRLQTLRRLAHTLRSDLFTTTDTEASEAIMLKRIEISNRIERLSKLENTIISLTEQLKGLSVEWNTYLDQKNKLPKKDISESDIEKITLLKKRFIENLKRYHYSSLSSFEGIEISINSSLLPTIDGFDMKFDSSASDGIRVIWAFTMALLQVSIEKNGNHPGVIIFDEPAQQSIVPEDMKSFIKTVVEIKKSFQIITAITLNSQELIDIIDNLDTSSYHKILIEGKSFKKL
ncbi:coiled-coil domain-containing protein [Ruminococcus sp.]|uniref:coiled-coil domain-containing protein n=1 Tax=Ruminococcus sp. TaxID=41978 RepID=UPI0039956E9D